MKTQERWTDPIIDEIHQIRREIVEEAGGTLEALVTRLMKNQERHGERLVTRSPRRTEE